METFLIIRRGWGIIDFYAQHNQEFMKYNGMKKLQRLKTVKFQMNRTWTLVRPGHAGDRRQGPVPRPEQDSDVYVVDVVVPSHDVQRLA